MSYEIKNAMIQRDTLDESFELIDPNGHFKDEEVLVAIDNNTLITIQLLINSIVKNDFKKWKEINEKEDLDPVESLFIKLGYSREELFNLLKEI